MTRSARLGAGLAARAVRCLRVRPAGPRTSASSCTRSRSARSCRSSPRIPRGGVDRKKMEMTQDVMANSLVYWVQDLYRGGFLRQGSQVYAMNPRGRRGSVPTYGVGRRRRRPSSRTSGSWPWSSLVRERDHGQRDPGRRDAHPGAHEDPRARHVIASATQRNPTGRMTTPQDVPRTPSWSSQPRHRLHQR